MATKKKKQPRKPVTKKIPISKSFTPFEVAKRYSAENYKKYLKFIYGDRIDVSSIDNIQLENSPITEMQSLISRVGDENSRLTKEVSRYSSIVDRLSKQNDELEKMI